MLALLTVLLLIQAPAERDTIEQWRARFGGEADASVLAAWEAEGIARARVDRDDPMRHLELGFLAYRLGEVTGTRQHFDDAAGEFAWAAELRPAWPYPWYGLGLAELALGEHDLIAVENIRQILGRDHLSQAARAFARATLADPAFARAVIELARTALRQRIGARLDVARAALRAATAGGAGRPRPELFLLLGRIERRGGEADSAWRALEAYVAAGGDAALGRLELARTAFWLERSDTARALYYAGAVGASAAARQALREDLLWIATPDELAAFDRVRAGPPVADWLHGFWRRRDASAGRAPGDRLAEHYRRLAYARRHFGLVSPHRVYDVTERYRSAQRDVDDRGVIYIRHGEPHARATFSAPGVEPNVSWRYAMPDGPRLFHFVARGDVQDYRLVESLIDVFGMAAAVTMQAGGAVSPQARALFDSRGDLDPRYRALAAGGMSVANALASERRRGREALREGTTTDSYVLRFPRALASLVHTYVVTDRTGTSRLLTLFAVPGARLAGRPFDGQVAYPLRLRVAAVPPGGAPVFLDTLRTFVAPAALAPGEQLAGVLDLALPPGGYAVTVTIADPIGGAGAVVIRDSVVAPRATGGVTLSDLVLGDTASGLAWHGAGAPVPLTARLAFPSGGRVALYFEVLGLRRGAPYRARLEVRRRGGGSIFRRIWRLFGGDDAAVALAWQGAATGPTTRVRQTIDLADVDGGDYRLVLRVEGPGGARLEREVPFRVLDTR